MASLAEQLPGLDDVHQRTLGDPRVCVAVLDGPIQSDHPALVGARLSQLGPAVEAAGAAAGHGTMVASILFGNGQEGVQGLVPHCRGLSIPIFRSATDGRIQPASQMDLAHAISWALEMDADVINISGGQFANSAEAYPLLTEVIHRCRDRGTLIVAAAGNDGCECIHLPAAIPNVLAVGASDQQGDPLPLSNWGEAYRGNGLLAPGDRIPGANVDKTTRSASGTSLATAVVSGVVALLLSLQKQLGVETDATGIGQLLLDTADRCDDDSTSCRRWLHGKLNLTTALATLMPAEEFTMSQSDSNPALPNESEQPSTITPGGLPAEYDASIQPVPPAVEDANIETATPAVAPSEVTPSACSCNCGGPQQLVFALGQLNFDYGTEARRDSIHSHMGLDKNPHDPKELAQYLKDNTWDAASIIWTLNFDETAVYALKPEGPYAAEICKHLRKLLEEQSKGNVGIISVPGIVNGSERLLNGQVVPSIAPEMRGIYDWQMESIVKAIAGPIKSNASKRDRENHHKKALGIESFLERVYYELRNLGRSPEERAINFAATNAFELEHVYEKAMKDDMDLDTIEVERSPICRPESDCWDVKLIFFFPQRQVQTVRRVFRFTVDVSDVVPVKIGKMREWHVR